MGIASTVPFSRVVIAGACHIKIIQRKLKNFALIPIIKSIAGTCRDTNSIVLSIKAIKMPIPAQQSSSHTEKRRHCRRQWRPRLSGIFVSDDGKKMLEQLQGIDISKGGMGITGSTEHPVGTHLIINLPEHNSQSKYVHAKVVRCWKEESQIHLGLEFDDSPDDLVVQSNFKLRTAA